MNETTVGPYVGRRVSKGNYLITKEGTEVGRVKYVPDALGGSWAYITPSTPPGRWSGASHLATVLEMMLPEKEEREAKAVAFMEALFRLECSSF